MKLVIIDRFHDRRGIVVIPADKIQQVDLEIWNRSEKKELHEYCIRVCFANTHQLFEFGKDEDGAKNCLNNIIEQMRGE